ncbi:MAG: response regulator [Deltaproteobacteria bacterium]|nr:response regulator [Deltaproteobacteria bacterium]
MTDSKNENSTPDPQHESPEAIRAEKKSLELQLKQVEEALHRSERRFHFLADAAIDAIFVIKEGFCLDANQAAAKMFGYDDPAEFLGMDELDIIAPQSRETVTQYICDAESDIPCEAIGLRRDDSTFPVEIKSREIIYDDGDTVRVNAVRDVSSRRDMEYRFKLAAEITRDLLYEWNAVTDTVTWFGNIDAVLGLTFGERPGNIREWRNFVHVEDRAMFDSMAAERYMSPEQISREYRVVCKNGALRYWTDRSAPVVVEHQKGLRWLGVCSDITELKETEAEKVKVEKQLQQSQKMEAIGRLAGGIAHDVNNLLGVILNSATMLKLDGEVDEDIEEDLENIVEACKRGRDLTKNLLGFARKGKYVREDISVNKVVHDAIALLSRTLSKQIKVDMALQPRLDHVEGDPGQLEHAVMNLFINSSDAMDEAGTLSIRTSSVSIPSDDEPADLKLDSGRYIRLDISDTGKGMDDATLQKAVEPFFTTKPEGKGTGLGLSMVYGTVRSHRGDMHIESSPGTGTTISIYLPSLNRRRTTMPNTAPWPSLGAESSEISILVIDDEPMVLRSTRRVLQRMGYTVHTARDGEEALRQFKAHQTELSLVMLDMIMPDMDGSQVFSVLRQIDPGVKVLICSGYARDRKVETLLAAGARAFIQKPFDLELLSHTVKTILESD